MAAIGMMEGAFFVGRKEIVDWINNMCELNIGKVEDTASGAISCQLLDIMHPGQVPMSKVNWSAKQSFEFVGNYKILQTCFNKLHIDKAIDVDRLIKGQYMDNLEFMQWFKAFFERSVQDKGDYDAVAQRTKGKGGSSYQFNGRGKPSSAPASSGTKVTAPRVPAMTRTKPTPGSPPQKENAAPATSVASSTAAAGKKPSGTTSSARGVGTASTAEVASLKQSLAEQTTAYTELRTEMDGLEKERDFYFDKLRDIEKMLQDVEDEGNGTELTASIFKILYATAEGFEPVQDDAAGVEAAASNEETF